MGRIWHKVKRCLLLRLRRWKRGGRPFAQNGQQIPGKAGVLLIDPLGDVVNRARIQLAHGLVPSDLQQSQVHQPLLADAWLVFRLAGRAVAVNGAQRCFDINFGVGRDGAGVKPHAGAIFNRHQPVNGAPHREIVGVLAAIGDHRWDFGTDHP